MLALAPHQHAGGKIRIDRSSVESGPMPSDESGLTTDETSSSASAPSPTTSPSPGAGSRVGFLTTPTEVDRQMDRASSRTATRGPSPFRKKFSAADKMGASFRASQRGSDLRDLASQLVPVDMGDENLIATLELLRKKHLSSDSQSLIDPTCLKFVSTLGAGAFGMVWKGEWRPVPGTPVDERREGLVAAGGGFVAVKKLKLSVDPSQTGETPRAEPPPGPPALVAPRTPYDPPLPPKLTARDLADFCNELLTLRALSHAHVIGYIGCTLHSDGTGAEQLSIVTELATHGTLKPLICHQSGLSRPFTTADGLRWASHIAEGMAYLHDCKPPIIHRDLKPENILLCGPRAVAKIGDFGLVTFEHQAQRNANFKLTGQVGSVRYMAPENFRGEPYTHANDVYSYAILLYELLMRTRAYEGLYIPVAEIGRRAADPSTPLRPAIPPPWPAEARKLLELCWHADPAQRPEFVHISTELSNWRYDPSLVTLREIAKGSKRGLFEMWGFGKAMLKDTWAERYSSESGSYKKGARPLAIKPGDAQPADREESSVPSRAQEPAAVVWTEQDRASASPSAVAAGSLRDATRNGGQRDPPPVEELYKV